MANTPTWERHHPKRTIGAHVIGHDEVTSTMDVARELADAGAVHGTAVQAAFQARGRGRFSRRWVSDPTDSLLLSVILRAPPLTIGPLIAIGATVAVVDAVRSLSGLECTVKWPNDVLVGTSKGTRKLCGVLVEASADTSGSGVAVLGIGLNVNLDPSRYPEVADIATSVTAETGERYRIVDAAEALFDSLDALFGGEAPSPGLLNRWRSLLDTLGQRVTVHQRDGVLAGTAEGVDDDGRLLLRTDDGALHVLSEGDVTLRG
jgi:BirA family biotin operon repressor/biotin-[acetyl-CoA-carboxylase] ligase